MLLTTTEIKHIDNGLDIVDELGTEIDLDHILVKELKSGLLSDINNGW